MEVDEVCKDGLVMNVQLINEELLTELHKKAVENDRLRMNFDLRTTPDDTSQRMLNALEPGTVMPIHRHHGSSETVVILRGKIRWMFYDENGAETERVLLDADGDVRCLNAEKDRWHSLECLESAVLFEAKNGGYRALMDDEIMEV